MNGMETDNKGKTDTKVEIIDGGPLKISGRIVLKDLKRDITVNLDEVCLCLCGRTETSPYCDKSHCNNSPGKKE